MPRPSSRAGTSRPPPVRRESSPSRGSPRASTSRATRSWTPFATSEAGVPRPPPRLARSSANVPTCLPRPIGESRGQAASGASRTRCATSCEKAGPPTGVRDPPESPGPRARPRPHWPAMDQAIVLDALDYGTFLTLLRGHGWPSPTSGGVQEEGATLGVPVLVTRRRRSARRASKPARPSWSGTDRSARPTRSARAAARRRGRGADAFGRPQPVWRRTGGGRIVEILTRDLDA